MANAGYLPRADKDRTVWLNNFSNKIGAYATSLGLTAAEVTAIANDAAMFTYVVMQVEVYDTAKSNRVSYKNLLRDGPLGKPGGPVPTAPAAGVVPTAVTPGIFPRVAQYVQRIKNSSNYTEAIGSDLGIIATHVQAFDAANMKPALKLVIKGGQVEVQWVKGDSDGVRIEVDRGTGTWQFLAIDTVPHYPDTTPITGPATWKYRAMYIVNDEAVGQWSDVASIAVG